MSKLDISAIAGASVVAAACAFPVAAAPVKIGLVETLSGPQASSGQAYRAAVRFAVDRINQAGGWNGEPVQLLEYDNQGGPAGAADKLKAAAADGVHLIVQGASSAIGGQITEDVRKYNLRNAGKEMVYINMGAEALELTGEKCNFYHFRFASNAQVRAKALVEGMKKANALGTKVYAINQNYSWGQDMEQATVDNQQAGGYTVVAKTLHDVNRIQDFAPYVARIAASGADTVITGNWSNDLLLLMKASKAAAEGALRHGLPGSAGQSCQCGRPGRGQLRGAYLQRRGGPGRCPAVRRGLSRQEWQRARVHRAADGLRHADGGRRAQAHAAPGRQAERQCIRQALESARIQTPMGEMSMREQDHQAQMPMVVSVVSRDAKLKVDGTDMGFAPALLLSAQEAATPPQASCQMKRPG